MQSRDILIRLALEYDLPTLLNFCRTSKRVNEIVCNNKFFWMNKLNKDFGINKDDIETFKNRVELGEIPDIENIQENTEKKYYQEITDWLNSFKNINILYQAILAHRLDIVKIALKKGADMNTIHNGFTPLTRAVFYGENQIAAYLVDHGAVKTKSDFVKNVSNMLTVIEKAPFERKLILFTYMYDELIPRIYNDPEKIYSRLWPIMYEKLEEHRNLLPDLYERRAHEIRALF